MCIPHRSGVVCGCSAVPTHVLVQRVGREPVTWDGWGVAPGPLSKWRVFERVFEYRSLPLRARVVRRARARLKAVAAARVSARYASLRNKGFGRVPVGCAQQRTALHMYIFCTLGNKFALSPNSTAVPPLLRPGHLRASPRAHVDLHASADHRAAADLLVVAAETR